MIGSSRSSHVLASSYSGGHGKPTYGDMLQNYGSARGAPAWLETGDSVANLYSESREAARDHARLRNAYFEQVGQPPIACIHFPRVLGIRRKPSVVLDAALFMLKVSY
ncbi:hypothetical protein MKX03_024918 [Papaver bracteatum]|nr:hypothetical protein MKX03_024918 [Papaver bracteatum]